jgi:hypothetical protein
MERIRITMPKIQFKPVQLKSPVLPAIGGQESSVTGLFCAIEVAVAVYLATHHTVPVIVG